MGIILNSMEEKKNLEITGIPGGKSFMNDPY